MRFMNRLKTNKFDPGQPAAIANAVANAVAKR
jgi:hypothetical protein